MSNIISDISKRVLIVIGEEEVKRIEFINNNTDIMNVKKLYDNVFEIELIKRVGDYFKK